MKKLLLLALLITPILVGAQSIKKTKVNSSYISYPKIDVKDIDLSALKVEFCSGNMAFLDKKVLKTTNVCNVKGGSILDAKSIDVFYYKINVNKPTSYIKLSNQDNEIAYIEKASSLEKGFVEFGKNECYWADMVLKSAYKKQGIQFEITSVEEDKTVGLENAKNYINNALFFTYVPHELFVFSLKSKNHDYSDINDASDNAAKALEELKNNVDNKTAQDNLRNAVTVWNKALAESDSKDKKAKINKKVTIAISENIATVNMYLREYDKAKKVLINALSLEKNVTTPAKVRRESLLSTIVDLKKRYDVNKEAEINLKKEEVNVISVPSSELTKFETDYKSYQNKSLAEDIKDNNEDYEKDVADGSVNPYKKYVVEAVNGNTLILPNLGAKLMKLPAGDKLDEFPLEVLELDIANLILKGNNIKSIPASISRLEGLKKLDLSKNNLTSLPIELGELKNLKRLTLKGNDIPQSDIDKIQNLLPDCKIKL
jgi:hypothetical protein